MTIGSDNRNRINKIISSFIRRNKWIKFLRDTYNEIERMYLVYPYGPL